MTHFPLTEMDTKVFLSFLRLFPLEKQIERNPLKRRVFLSKREYFCTSELVQMFGADTNANKFCSATGGPVLASGEHVTGDLVTAAARGLLAAHGWVGGPRGRLHQLFTHCFFITLH